MNKYEEAFNVIETILHLMCGEEREDNYKPSHDEMVNSMEDFMELKKLKHEYFKSALALCDFVNKKGIKKENIVEIINIKGIYPFSMFYYE